MSMQAVTDTAKFPPSFWYCNLARAALAYWLADPRTGHGPGIGGFKPIAEIKGRVSEGTREAALRALIYTVGLSTDDAKARMAEIERLFEQVTEDSENAHVTDVTQHPAALRQAREHPGANINNLP